MTSAIVDQPAPIPQPPRRPVWEIVIEHTTRRRDEGAYGPIGTTVDLVIAAMRARAVLACRDRDPARDASPKSGLNHLIDAMYALLDSCFYLANDLAAHGVGPGDLLTIGSVPDTALRWQLTREQQLFADQIRAAICLRALIEERAS